MILLLQTLPIGKLYSVVSITLLNSDGVVEFISIRYLGISREKGAVQLRVMLPRTTLADKDPTAESGPIILHNNFNNIMVLLLFSHNMYHYDVSRHTDIIISTSYGDQSL